MNELDFLNRMAHNWEDQARACNTVRYWNDTNGIKDDLLIRSKVFEECAKELRFEITRLYKALSKTSAHKPKAGSKR